MNAPDPDGAERVERTELLTPQPAAALAGLLGAAAPAEGELLPLLWHWVYLLERPRQSDLGHDGHPVHGIPSPPGPGRSRMFAGGRVRTIGALRVGAPATRRSRVTGRVEKEGRSGAMTFVTVEHRISQDGVDVVVDEQDIVYRSAPLRAAGVPVPEAAPPPDDQRDALEEHEYRVDPTLLFRFSALTYNAHRIHYDRDYARDEEGYPGLVVHGPLQALLMAQSARAGRTSLDLDFRYRLVAPLFEGQGLFVGRGPADGATTVQVRDRSGRITAVGTLKK